ncbi:MoxR family ATPase [Natrialba sp. INN-245]|uniref:AAA family ATPase n=1 Tax=Natrialba sp. INN-245 TaxID=2690967 RepID=UPI0013103B58|nr:MoxR family ATPase [Natrialba sp. INN-245]MWV40016.1 AAA domain-containing protein [Natrialba sp. INN-245]
MTRTNRDPGDDIPTPQEIYERIDTTVGRVLIGNDDAIEQLTIAVLTGSHLLLEGVPGVAKTTMANLFARASGLDYRRIQMTPDVLPADIVGTHVYREHTGEFELRRGPIFTNLIVADEINRATPKTQSALLEAMAENHVTIEGTTLELPDPFMVIATQNPIEMDGVFELPEAQRDRFQFKLTVDLPDRDVEAELLDRFDSDPNLGPSAIDQVVDPAVLVSARQQIYDVFVAEPVKQYILDLVSRTRIHPDVAHGASPRASLTFLHGAKARAAINGRNYVIPDDVKKLARSVLVHRLVLNTEADISDVRPADVVADVIESVDVPDVQPRTDSASVS